MIHQRLVKIVVWMIGCSLVSTGVAYAQSQRLGLPAGTFSVEPGGSVSRRGYCMDLGVPAPNPGVALPHLLTDATGMEVVIGQREPLSVPAAIEAGYLRLEARGMYEGRTVEEVRQDATADAGVRLILESLEQELLQPGLYSALRDRPASEALEVIQEYRADRNVTEEVAATLDAIGRMLAGGDGEHVVFVNTTSESMEVRIKEPAVFAERAGTLDDILLDIPESGSDIEHASNQARIWRDNSAIHAALSGKDVDAYFASEDMRTGLTTFTRLGRETFVLSETDTAVEVRVVEDGRIREVIRGDDALPQFSRKLNEQLVESSDRSTQFVRFDLFHDAASETVRMQLGRRSVEVRAEELGEFLAGNAVPETFSAAIQDVPEGTRVIVWRDPLFRLAGPEEQLMATTLARRLHETFGDRMEVFLDDDMQSSKVRAATIQGVSGPSDLALLSDKQSFPLEDWGIVENVEEYMQELGAGVYRDITLERLNAALDANESNIVVLSGHKDDAFREYYRALSTNGVLKDRVVLMLSCYQPGDEALNSEVMRSENAPKAVFFLDVEIDPAAVEDVLHAVGEELRGNEGREVKLRDLLDRCIDRALNDDSISDRKKAQIELLRRAVIQVSAYYPQNDSRDWLAVMVS